MSGDTLTIVVEATPQRSTSDLIDDGLDSDNAQFCSAPFDEFAVALQSPDDEGSGGIYAQVWAGLLTTRRSAGSIIRRASSVTS